VIVAGNAVATQANKTAALASAVKEMADAKAPIIEQRMTETLSKNVVEEFQANAHSSVLVNSFNENATLVQQGGVYQHEWCHALVSSTVCEGLLCMRHLLPSGVARAETHECRDSLGFF